MKMKKLSETTPYLLMTGVVAIVAIVALVLNGGGSLEGAVSSADACTDSDTADDRLVKGILRTGLVEEADYCVGDVLFQKYCWTGWDTKDRRGFNCAEWEGYSGCSEGVCVK